MTRRRVLIATARPPFGPPPLQPLAQRLAQEMEAMGHAADIVQLPLGGNGARGSAERQLAIRLFDWGGLPEVHGDRLIALDIPGCWPGHDDVVLWFAGVGSVEDTGYPDESMAKATESTRFPAAGRRFAVSVTASWILERLTGVAAVPLLPPVPDPERYRWMPPEDYFLLPAEGLGPERRSLTLRALALTRLPVRIRVVGPSGPERSWWRRILVEAQALGIADRIEAFDGVGGLPEAVARAMAVVRPERLDPLPWMAVRSALAAKALLTSADSGALAEAVVPWETGAVVEPRPHALAAVMDELWGNPALCESLGRGGHARWAGDDFGWSSVVDTLLAGG